MYDDLNKRQTEREKGKKRIKKTQTNDVQVYLSFNAKSLVVFFIRLARNTQTSQDKTKPTRIQTTIDDLKTTIWPAFFFFCLSASYTQFVPMYIVNSVSFQIAHSHIYRNSCIFRVLLDVFLCWSFVLLHFTWLCRRCFMFVFRRTAATTTQSVWRTLQQPYIRILPLSDCTLPSLFTVVSQMETWIFFFISIFCVIVGYCLSSAVCTCTYSVHFAYHHSSYFVSAIVVFSHPYFSSMSIDTHRASQMHEICAFNWK